MIYSHAVNITVNQNIV